MTDTYKQRMLLEEKYDDDRREIIRQRDYLEEKRVEFITYNRRLLAKMSIIMSDATSDLNQLSYKLESLHHDLKNELYRFEERLDDTQRELIVRFEDELDQLSRSNL